MISRLAHKSVVALFETVDNLRLHACAWITVVTTPTIAIISQTPVTVNNVPVVVAGSDLDAVDTRTSFPLHIATKLIVTPLLPADESSASVGAVV